MDVGTVLNVVLIALAAAAVWLIVEIVLTVRKARPVVDEALKAVESARPVIEHVDELVEQAKPVVAHLDEVVEGARPGVRQINPFLEQTSEAIGALSGDLRRLDAILGDVSRISKTAGNATTAVGDAAESLASKARTLFARKAPARVVAVEATPVLSESQTPVFENVGEEQTTDSEPGYFTYPNSDGSAASRS